VAATTPTTHPWADPDHAAMMVLDPVEVASHHRRIEISGFDRPGHLLVVGRLRDDRPWAAGTTVAEQVHDMTLSLLIRQADLLIVEARAEMARFPHPECPSIEPDFTGLVGLSVARGYNRAVQERFGRELGCSHLEFLARAMGPAVMQASGSSASRREHAAGGGGARARPIADRLVGSCHIWASGGPAEEKLALGWQPGEEYPAPTLVSLRRAAGVTTPPG